MQTGTLDFMKRNIPRAIVRIDQQAVAADGKWMPIFVVKIGRQHIMMR